MTRDESSTVMQEGVDPIKSTPWMKSKTLWLALVLPIIGLLSDPDVAAVITGALSNPEIALLLPPGWAPKILLIMGPIIAILRIVTGTAIRGTPTDATVKAEVKEKVDAAVERATQ